MDTTKKLPRKINELASLPQDELMKVIKQYIQELRDCGISRGKISEEVGLSTVSIWRIQNGKHHKTTAFQYGIKIAHLHAKVFKQKNQKK